MSQDLNMRVIYERKTERLGERKTETGKDERKINEAENARERYYQ